MRFKKGLKSFVFYVCKTLIISLLVNFNKPRINNDLKIQVEAEAYVCKMTWRVFILIVVCAVQCAKEPLPSPEPSAYFINNFVFDSLRVARHFNEIPILSDSIISISESSGAVASNSFDGCFWTINDSGNEPALFLFEGVSGRLVSTLSIPSIRNTDWESMDIYQDVQGHNKIIIADIGDNLQIRSTVKAYEFLEPDTSTVDTSMAFNVITPNIDSIEFTYSEGPKDVEAFFIDPVDKAWYFISKRESKNGLYQLIPNTDPAVDTAQLVGRLSMYLVTGADCKTFGADSAHIALRNYERVLLWPRHRSASVIQTMAEEPLLIRYGERETQGEAVWFWPNGDIGTCSELNGAQPKIRRYLRQ